MTAVTDAVIGLLYLMAPIIRYLAQGDKTPTERANHERL